MLDNFPKPAADKVLKVTEFTRLIKRQLEGNFRQVWVQGEVSNLRRQSSGHVYFSLKDAGSQLPCVLFARDAANQGFQLDNGMELQLFGDISVYEPHGRYQLITKIAIQSGEGKLQIEYERLKRSLAAEGLFDKDRKQTLPTLPLKIAVVTSPSGAAVRDFLRILRRREYCGEVVIFPARVQGQGAAEEIAAMLKHASASSGFDLVVITRGGGSIEDLWAFNEKRLARAVAACPLPIISAVGHEIDHVLTDYAADQRAETPSAAAELISSLYLNAVQNVETAAQNLAYYAHDGIKERTRDLRDLQARLQIIAPERQIETFGLKLDDLENKLGYHLRERLRATKDQLGDLSQQLAEHHPRVKLEVAGNTLNNLQRQLAQAVKVSEAHKRAHLAHLQTRLENSSLNATLKRGYSVMKGNDGSIVDSAASAKLKKHLSARFHDGEIELEIRPKAAK
jgi:exodeoxyribonuclease VII large subunit